MNLNRNSFFNYINKQNTLFRISNIRNYKLKSKIIAVKSNKALVTFGHYSEFKITVKELRNYFYYNRLLPILKNKTDLLKNKLNFVFKDINPQGNPILKCPIINFKTTNFGIRIKSLFYLKEIYLNKRKVYGRIIAVIPDGYLVALLGFVGFLPNAQIHGHNSYKKFSSSKTKTKSKELLYKRKTFIITNISFPFESDSISNLSKSVNNFNITLSWHKANRKLRKNTKRVFIKPLTYLHRIHILKKLKEI